MNNEPIKTKPNKPNSNPIYRGVASGEAGSNPIYRGVASGEAGSNPMLVRHQCGGSNGELTNRKGQIQILGTTS